MVIKKILAKKGLIEGLDYVMVENQPSPLLRKKWVIQPILDENGEKMGEQLEQVETLSQLPTEAEIKLEIGLEAQEIGAKVVAKVRDINESKNLTPEAFNALMSDESLARIERLLWTGSLKTAKLMISMLDNTFFTEDEKNTILEMLADV